MAHATLRGTFQSVSGLVMTRDEGPPEDDVPGLEPRSTGDQARHREQSIVQVDAEGSHAQNGASNKRIAQGTDSDAHAHAPKSEVWIDEFCAQCTVEMRDKLYLYAARRLSGARKVSSDSYAAHELVADAIADTLDGRAPWDCFGPPLITHLRTVIWRQIHANFRRAKRLRHVSIDEATAGEHSGVREDVESALRAQAPDERDAENARDAIALLRQRAQGDADVLALINAIAKGQTTRAGLRAITGFSVPRYRAVMRRFNRLVDEVGIELDLIRDGKGGT